MLRRYALETILVLTTTTAFASEAGRVTNTLTENPVENAKLKFYNPSGEFIAEYITDSNGVYNPPTGIEPTRWAEVKRLFTEDMLIKRRDVLKRLSKLSSSSNVLKAEITHQDYHNAVRYFDVSKGNFNATIAPQSFDMGFFDAWARGGQKVLRRWNSSPKFYINTNLAESSQIDLVKKIINVDLTEFTDGFVSATVEETTEQKNERGSILVYWDEKEDDYYGNHKETIENNEIVSASTWFNPKNHLPKIYLRQLTQCLGFLNNGVSGKDFWTNDGHYTQQGLDCGKFLYNSKPGNISPDTNPAPI
ncbi:MAG: hypothetical protein Q7R52_02255 [archaeon]|nr:hypothetical protein [archaeon]